MECLTLYRLVKLVTFLYILLLVSVIYFTKQLVISSGKKRTLHVDFLVIKRGSNKSQTLNMQFHTQVLIFIEQSYTSYDCDMLLFNAKPYDKFYLINSIFIV